MLANKYYVIYVEVSTGYPGVELIYAEDRSKLIESVRHSRNYAIIGITEGK